MAIKYSIYNSEIQRQIEEPFHHTTTCIAIQHLSRHWHKTAKMGPRSTIAQRMLIIAHFKNGYSHGKIASMVNMARSSVQTIITRFVRENRVHNKFRKATNKIFTELEETMIVQQYQNKPTTIPNLLKYVEKQFKKSCNLETIRRVLRAQKLFDETNNNMTLSTEEITDDNKAFLSIESVPSRISFAKEYLAKDYVFWDSVIFTGVAEFSPMYSKIGLKEHHEMIMKYKGSTLVVWGCISAAGVGNLVFVKRNMTKNRYLSILKENVVQYAQKFGIENIFHYYQNNNRDHEKAIQEWGIWNCPHVMKPPGYDLDINIVDNLWEILDQNLIFHSITDENDLQKALSEEWEKVTPEIAKNLVRTLPNRLQYIVDMA
ncbi:uncharacterized protein LOC111072153 [Drosophila obscura]|uniref:uncharacterized protein LOC111072153 n=1 Tax=Drosophila obscura TaxID=7282 RepID=UPI001BB11BA2|nr:uncharacterized protein LOC111072153 [Drosophila obscura]